MVIRKLLDRFKGERRAIDPSWQAVAGLSPTGQAVNARAAENLSTVMASVSAISTAIASLPTWVYRRTDQGREVDNFQALARLIRNGPNEHQSWPAFVEWLMASTLLKGNGLAEIITNQRGVVIGLKPIPWEWANPKILPNGRLAFDVSEMTSIHGGTGRTRRLLQHEVLHLRDRSDDGLIGKSRLQRAASVIQAGLSVQEFAGAMYANQATPGGVLECDAKIPPDQLGKLREQFQKAFTGPANAKRAMVLDQGLKWRSVSISPEDAELLASRRFTTEELARIYQVPPPLVGIWDHASFTNSETAGRWFAMHTLGPWIKKLEAEMSRSLLSEVSRRSHEIEFDLSGFLRGDHEARWKAHEIAVKNRILTPNEVRLAEGWNPREGGDSFPEEESNASD